MNAALWIVQGFLAVAYTAAGGFKLVKNRNDLLPMLPWVKHFPAVAPKLIGLAEVLGGIGLDVPMVTGIMPGLTPLAAACLAFLMLGAFATHLRLNDLKGSIGSVVLGLLSVFVAWGRSSLLQQ